MLIRRKLGGLFGLLWLLPLAGCKMEVLAPAGDVAARQRDLLLLSVVLMLLIIVPVMALIVIVARKDRAENSRATYRPDWDHSTKLELVIWGVPLLIIVTLGALTWVGTHLLDPYRPLDRIGEDRLLAMDARPVQVQVISLDWKWLFIYPEHGVAAVNRLVLPVDRPVEFTLTSDTVMNAFYIPAMAGMIYAMPGMQTKLHAVLNHEGEYKGISANYSGWGFSGMFFTTTVSDDAGFAAWIEEVRAGGGALDRKGYLELAAPSENVAPFTFAEVDPEIFSRVVNMCVEEGRMCMAEMMSLDESGGLGLAGLMNRAPTLETRPGRRGDRNPVLGWASFEIASICTPEENAALLAEAGGPAPARVDMSPLRGRALSPQETFFARARAAGARMSMLNTSVAQ
ncbi:MAG: ubiquinol oxidase subunit II [Pikeienuella sp.]